MKNKVFPACLQGNYRQFRRIQQYIIWHVWAKRDKNTNFKTQDFNHNFADADAVGKPGSGVTQGNVLWLGSYGLCTSLPSSHYCLSDLLIQVENEKKVIWLTCQLTSYRLLSVMIVIFGLWLDKVHLLSVNVISLIYYIARMLYVYTGR